MEGYAKAAYPEKQLTIRERLEKELEEISGRVIEINKAIQLLDKYPEITEVLEQISKITYLR